MNALSTFQWYINWILHQYLNNFCFIYLNNMLIFINGIWFKHCEHINKMLNCFNKAELFLNIKKCEFKMTRIKYLRFRLSTGSGRVRIFLTQPNYRNKISNPTRPGAELGRVGYLQGWVSWLCKYLIITKNSIIYNFFN